MAAGVRKDGWRLRSDIIWNKPNAMPESVKDRPARSHEYIFMLTKSKKCYYDAKATLENGRVRRTVWSDNTAPSAGAHFASFPASLIEPCIAVATKPGDFVLDSFFGTGTVGVVARDGGRRFIGIELNPDCARMEQERLGGSLRLSEDGGRGERAVLMRVGPCSANDKTFPSICALA
jgi:site-specific DNA-methyltransferase (adenine-specific)